VNGIRAQIRISVQKILDGFLLGQFSQITSTVMRVPRTTGFPRIIRGLISIRECPGILRILAPSPSRFYCITHFTVKISGIVLAVRRPAPWCAVASVATVAREVSRAAV
jgi:hypothetical protein